MFVGPVLCEQSIVLNAGEMANKLGKDLCPQGIYILAEGDTWLTHKNAEALKKTG